MKVISLAKKCIIWYTSLWTELRRANWILLNIHVNLFGILKICHLPTNFSHSGLHFRELDYIILCLILRWINTFLSLALKFYTSQTLTICFGFDVKMCLFKCVSLKNDLLHAYSSITYIKSGSNYIMSSYTLHITWRSNWIYSSKGDYNLPPK